MNDEKKKILLEEIEEWLIRFEIGIQNPLKPGDQVSNCREYFAKQVYTLFDPDSTFSLKEEEKKESKLYFLINEFGRGAEGTYSFNEVIELKQRIIDLVKDKVDTCKFKGTYFHTRWIEREDLMKKLEEM